jgi:hypothetical protein
VKLTLAQIPPEEVPDVPPLVPGPAEVLLAPADVAEVPPVEPAGPVVPEALPLVVAPPLVPVDVALPLDVPLAEDAPPLVLELEDVPLQADSNAPTISALRFITRCSPSCVRWPAQGDRSP